MESTLMQMYDQHELGRLSRAYRRLLMAMIPPGYVNTGTHDGLVVCCLDRNFNRFCASCDDGGGFVLVPALVPLGEYKKRIAGGATEDTISPPTTNYPTTTPEGIGGSGIL